ncbi:MAG: TonB-dependent receptor [Proteobacteria bacterium]|nr:TonB-dependent receptor [Pseudomonadota bacterium]
MSSQCNGTLARRFPGLAALLVFLAAAGPAPAQTSPAAQSEGAGAQGASALGEVVITGTRRTDRTVTDSASPIDVIGGPELQAQPAANMLDVVKNIVPSFFVGQNTISDASSLVRAPSLRGLPSDEVLVMLNGKRFNRSALVQVYNGGDTGLSFGSQGSDLSVIPTIAIARLDVLRDGATAQYGSDAIAGVLNYGLRDDAGFEVRARYGQYEHGDGRGYQVDANGGLKFGSGFANLSAEFYHDNQTSTGATRPTAVAFAQENPALASQLPNYPLPVQIFGQSPSRGFKLLLNSGLEVTDRSKLYLIANFADIQTNESFNFRSSLVGTRPFTNTAGGVDDLGGRSFFQHPYYETQCPAGNPTCPADGYVQDNNTFLLSSIYPAGFTPRFVGKTKQAYGTLGYKGSTESGLNYDLSTSQSRNALDLSMYSSISPSFGSASQTSFRFGQLIQKESDFNLDLTYNINAGLASPLTLSGGAEFRHESYEATAGDFQSYAAGPYASPHPLYVQTSPGVYAPTGTFTATEDPAASGYGGTSPTYAGTHSQNSRGFYVGLEGDVLKSLSMGVAGRYENYSSFGSATVGKFNVIWHIIDTLAVRATVGSGFHAPSPGQNNAQVLTTNFIAGVSTQTGTFPVTSAVARYYGAQALKPEKSTNYGAGLVFTPSGAFTATLDFYQIDVRDRIFISRTYNVTPADIAALPELASVGDGGQVQYFTNTFSTTTKGVDLVGTWRTDFADGKLNLSLAYNYNKSDVTKFDPTVISNDQIIDVEHLAPNHRATFTANWVHDAFALSLRENYYGSWIDANDYPTAIDPNSGSILAGQKFGAKFTTDVDASYTVMDRYTFTLGAVNVFNTRPDRIAATPSNPIYPVTGGLSDGQVYPRNGGPFGINGGFWYVSVQAKF